MSGELILTAQGIAQIANANQGGLLVKPAYFQIGDGTTEPEESDTSLDGNLLYQANISYVEVVSPKYAKFTFDLPNDIGGVTDPFTFTEIAIYGADDVMMARGTFDSPFAKSPGIGIRINVLMAASNCDLTSLDVTIGDYNSIPSTPGVDTLPKPIDSVHNVVAVLTMNTNTDGDATAGIAIKNGAGAMHWSFVGYDKIFAGKLTTPGDIVGSPQIFRLPNTINSSVSFTDSEVVIIQTINGDASNGETRQAVFNQSLGTFEVQNLAFPFFTDNTVIHVWQKIRKTDEEGTANPCAYPPSRNGIPSDYVLRRGSSTCPEWAPPSAATSIASTLYRPPGLMQLDWQTFSGNGQTKTFDIGTRPENIKFLFVTIGGVFQHRNTYTLTDTKITFSEVIRPDIEVQVIRIYNDTSVSSGAFIEAHTETFVGESQKRTFDLSNTPVDGDGKYLLVTVDGFLQHTNSFTYVGTQIQFSEAPPAGSSVEATVFSRAATTGFSMDITTASYVTTDFTESIELPVQPDAKDYVFVSYSGILLNRSAYAVSGTVLYFQASELSKNPLLYAGQPLEVTVFHNRKAEGGTTTNLKGLVTDVIPSVNSIKFMRHDTPELDVPIPRVQIKGGDRISVVDSYPEITIHSDIREGAGFYTGAFKYSTKHTMEDVEELIYVYPYKFQHDVMLMMTADFSVRLGPNFRVNNGNESVEYSIGFRHGTHKEPPYNRRIKGTGSTGFTWLPGGHFASANASISTTFEFMRSNITDGVVELVARMRIRNALISEYNSLLEADFSMLSVPRK